MSGQWLKLMDVRRLLDRQSHRFDDETHVRFEPMDEKYCSMRNVKYDIESGMEPLWARPYSRSWSMDTSVLAFRNQIMRYMEDKHCTRDTRLCIIVKGKEIDRTRRWRSNISGSAT